MKKDENQHFNQCSHEITDKILKKNKIFYRPTDPNFFDNVSGNSTLIFFGLTRRQKRSILRHDWMAV